MPKPAASPCYHTNMRRALRAISGLYDDALRPLGLSAAQYHLLINLSRLEPIDTTHFAMHLGLERSTLVRNMRVLTQNGWVQDLSSSGNKHQFCLSEQGRLLLAQAIIRWENTQNTFAAYMSPADSAELTRLLLKAQTIKWPNAATI